MRKGVRVPSALAEVVERAMAGVSGEMVEATLRTMRPSIRLLPDPTRHGLHIGGRPRVPSSFEWPAHSGRPLSFLAQFDLERVVEHDLEELLPTRGSLCLFYDPDELGNTPVAIRWFPDVCELSPREPPSGVVARHAQINLGPTTEWTLASPSNIPDYEKLDEFGAAWDSFHHGLEEAEERLRIAQGFEPDERVATHHRLLGHPDLIQLNGVAEGTTLLIQIDHDPLMPPPGHPRAGLDWGDAGKFFLFATIEWLRSHRDVGFEPSDTFGIVEMS